MAQPQRYILILLILTLFILAAVRVAGPNAIIAQEIQVNGQSGAGQGESAQQDTPAEQAVGDTNSMLPEPIPFPAVESSNNSSMSNIADAANSSVDGYLYVFVADSTAFGGNRIYGYEVNKSTGVLSPIDVLPLSVGQSGLSQATIGEMMAYDGSNAILYVANDVEDTFSAYAVELTSGALVEKLFSPIDLGAGVWTCIDVHPNGSPVIASEINLVDPSNVARFKMPPGSAPEAVGSPFSAGAAKPFGCGLSQDGNYYYTGGSFGSLIAEFSVDEPTAVLAHLAGSPLDSGFAYSGSYATDSSGRLFASSWDTSEVAAFTSSNGILSPVNGNPFASSVDSAGFGLLHPSGYYMVVDRSSSQVAVFEVAGSGSSTTLTEVKDSPFAESGTWPHVLALNSTGAYLFTANALSRNITTFAVNSSTGSLRDEGTQAQNAMGASGTIQGMAFVPIPGADLKFYGDRSAFNSDFPNATVEDFEDAKAVGSSAKRCSTPIDKASSDPCFDPGDIVDGVQFIANPPLGFAFEAIDSGYKGEPTLSKTIGASTDGTLDIVFPDNTVYAIGGDFFSRFYPNDTFLFTIYGPAGKLLSTVTSDVVRSGTFWGVATADYISRVNVAALKPITTKKHEGFDNIAFGKNKADFTGTPTTVIVNHPVKFTNKCVGLYTSCSWNFGDGLQSSSCGSPSKTYKAEGTCEVTLTVSGFGGADTRTRSSYIKVQNYTVLIPVIESD